MEPRRNEATGEGRIVDGYRLDVRDRLVASLLPGALVAMLGGVLLFFGIQPIALREPEVVFQHRPTFRAFHAEGEVHYITPGEEALLVSGGVLLLLSPFVLAFCLRRLVVEDFLVLRTDGLVRQIGTRTEIVKWDDVDDVRYDDSDDTVRLVLSDGTEHVIREHYTGLDQRELARRVAEVRRKALWNLLPAQRS